MEEFTYIICKAFIYVFSLLLIPLLIDMLCRLIPKFRNSHPQLRYLILAVLTVFLFIRIMVPDIQTVEDAICYVLAAPCAAALFLIGYRLELREYLAKKKRNQER